MSAYNDLINACNEKGMLRVYDNGVQKTFDALPTLSPNNIGIPGGALTTFSPETIKFITQFQASDRALGGRKKLIPFENDDYKIPYIEYTGQTRPYDDYDDAYNAGINVNFKTVGHYVFSSAISVGERLQSQLSKVNIDLLSESMNAASLALSLELNRAAFHGYIENKSTSFLVYGLLNYPDLGNYKTPNPNKTFAAMSWDELLQFFNNAITDLIEQTGNNLQVSTNIRCVVASKAFQQLMGKYSQFGVNVVNEIKENLSKQNISLEFVSAAELNGANANQDVCYFIVENSLGGSLETATLGYSELGRLSRMVYGETYLKQKMSSGTTGAVIYKPIYITRYTNI